MKIVLDTNVLISAMLSGGGAFRQILRMSLEGELTPLVSSSLCAEYEDVLGREEIFSGSVLPGLERNELFDALMSSSTWVQIHFLWRPNLRDEGDNHLIELAVAGGASWIVTSNLRDFSEAQLRFDHIRVVTAGAFMSEWRQQK